MKAITTTLIICILAMTANGQILNGGFEDWEDLLLFESPEEWNTFDDAVFYGQPTVTRSTDAQDGTHSIRLETIDYLGSVLSGNVFHGEMDQGGPSAGIPYPDNFEAISLYYKSDLNPGDSLYLVMLRYQFGNVVGFNSIPLAFGNNPTWTPQVVYVGNTQQDSLFFGFMITDPFGASNPTVGSWAMVDNIQFLSGGVQTSTVPNPSFETWEDVTVENPENWYTFNELLAGIGFENTMKTTDANSGNFAIEMTTLGEGNDTIPSYLSIGEIDITLPYPFENAPYSGTATSLFGRYKYAPANGDMAEIFLQFYENGLPIATLIENLGAANSYTSFSFPINLTGTPDSVNFYIHSGLNPGSVLKIDDLDFNGGNIGLNELSDTDFLMYPNPASEKVTLVLPNNSNYEIEILSLDGKSIYSGVDTGSHAIDLMEIPSGIYVVHIFNSNEHVSKRLIIE